MSKIILTMTYHSSVELDLVDYGHEDELMWSDLSEDQQNEIIDSEQEDAIIEVKSVLELETEEFEGEEEDPYCINCGSEDLACIGSYANGSEYKCNHCGDKFM